MSLELHLYRQPSCQKTILYREAVASHSPRLPPRQPWVSMSERFQPQRGCVNLVATRSGLLKKSQYDPGLKQPWAAGGNRFAVDFKLKASGTKLRTESLLHPYAR